MAGQEKQLVICVDDFGQHPYVNEAVYGLAEAGRVSATSCLTEAPAWADGAGRIREFDIQTGLHINFTQTWANSPGSLGLSCVMAMAWLRQWSRQALLTRLHRQCDLFEKHMKRAPDFFDGHQHVHQFPQIRDALLQVLAQRYDSRVFWVRSTLTPQAWRPGRAGLKATAIARLGGHALRRRLGRAGIGCNAEFAGVYDFQGGVAGFAAHMRRWLDGAADGLLLMCHPAVGLLADDAPGEQRIAEYRYLQGAAFADLLQAGHWRVARRFEWSQPAAGTVPV